MCIVRLVGCGRNSFCARRCSVVLSRIVYTIHNTLTLKISFEPSQVKVLTGGGDLREAQVVVPLSVSHSSV